MALSISGSGSNHGSVNLWLPGAPAFYTSQSLSCLEDKRNDKNERCRSRSPVRLMNKTDSEYLCFPRIDKKPFGEVIVFVLDDGCDETCSITKTDYQSISIAADTVQRFKSLTSLQYTLSHCKSQQIFLIVAGSFVKNASNFIPDLPRRVMFYLLSAAPLEDDNTHQLPTPDGIYCNMKDLLKKMFHDILMGTNSMVQILLFPANDEEKSTRDIDMQRTKYNCIEMILTILLRIPTTETHVKNLFDMCYSYCSRRKTDYEELVQFSNRYSRGKAIHWYTRNSFVYRLLNRVLRQDNLTQILTFGFYIADLHSLLMERHAAYVSCLTADQNILIVYRGQLMSSTEFKRLSQCINGCTSFNTFLSATFDIEVAKIYAGDGSRSPFYESVIFEIKIDAFKPCEKAFSPVESDSPFQDEHELLFTLGTIFRIRSIQKFDSLWKVELELDSTRKNFPRWKIPRPDEKNFTPRKNLSPYHRTILPWLADDPISLTPLSSTSMFELDDDISGDTFLDKINAYLDTLLPRFERSSKKDIVIDCIDDRFVNIFKRYFHRYVNKLKRNSTENLVVDCYNKFLGSKVPAIQYDKHDKYSIIDYDEPQFIHNLPVASDHYQFIHILYIITVFISFLSIIFSRPIARIVLKFIIVTLISILQIAFASVRTLTLSIGLSLFLFIR